ncbi:bifunctional 2-polyprenyl-6-hydroxyphenol methylase/3-demethylubiquinol 3-O-methyltransferase UbiG [Streptomyces sp. Ag109_O5-10]|uniref:class I SAM-dependent methyltransferase n=1 Tax=Streptomyces sp. Ag109_O5-10 TaxID=1855349 RepID=UPI000899DC14|nr:class I SAM-dependent methyltransferase [Streptomyces sp. Ag109_O5-10]SEE61080.1 Methyltransferase domain-containing protein [Streptomyces sp. Ag109_O5-10]
MTAEEYWNHNVHYHPVVLDAVPDGCRAALDVGCGDGLLAAKLATRAESVTGVDRSAEMIRRAQKRDAGNVAFLEGDYLDGALLDAGSYDFVSAVAVIHHAPFDDAIERLVELLAPGGRLVVVGMACDRTLLDWVVSGCGVPASRLNARLRGGKRAPSDMPVEDPIMNWGEVRRATAHVLPGRRYRRRLLWRYTLVWDKPDGTREGGP